MRSRVDYGWPPLMLLRTAAKYTQRHSSALHRAIRAGDLAVAGRNGRSLVFRREDLDAWMLGKAPELKSSTDRVAAHDHSAALARIEATRLGKVHKA